MRHFRSIQMKFMFVFAIGILLIACIAAMLLASGLCKIYF